MSDVKTLSDATFAADVAAGPIVVDFWAPWCGPCRMVGPIIDELNATYGEKVTFGKLNVDENPAVAATFGVRSIPTLIVLRGGKVVDQQIGALPQPRIAEMLERQLAPSGAGAREA